MVTLIKVLPKLSSSSSITFRMCVSCCFSSGKTSPIKFTTTLTSLGISKNEDRTLQIECMYTYLYKHGIIGE